MKSLRSTRKYIKENYFYVNNYVKLTKASYNVREDETSNTSTDLPPTAYASEVVAFNKTAYTYLTFHVTNASGVIMPSQDIHEA
jgi:hypothetical protein